MKVKLSKGFFTDLAPLNATNPFIPSVLVSFKKIKKFFERSKNDLSLIYR